ncbi:MAG: L,D-transpeptidase family protein [Defluviitaleaceae bacterium]|nr:L,D-transpeptidase family protein [Defluviitaleaceae bacterium]
MLKALILAGLLAFMPPFDVVAPSAVFAEVVESGDLFRDVMLKFRVGRVEKGYTVEVLEDYSSDVYRVMTTSGLTGWVSAGMLKIPHDPPTDMSVLPAGSLENFVNTKNFESLTEHLILVDIGRQKVHVFEGQAGAWQLSQSFDCSTGMNISPTTRGEFTLKDRGDWFYSYRLQSGAKYWIRFNGHYLFHTVPMDEDGNKLEDEDVVGVRRSNGCVRLMVEDMRWIYENIDDDTKVIIW